MLGCSLHESLFSYSDYCRSVATSVWIEERPSSLSALPFGFLAQSMSATSKIAISGEGSDELFAGYTCYVEGPVRAKGRLAQVAKLRAGGLDPRSTTVLAAERESQTKPGTDYAEAMLERIFWERLQFNHLELADRYFMAFGVECRVPFLDEALVDYAFSLPQPYKVDHAAGIQKVVLRCLLAGLHPVMAFSSLRRKQGLPGAASRHARRLTAELEGYVAQYQTDEARRVGLHGPRALSWDLFHAIHLEGRGARPDPLLAYRFMQAQGIQLGGSTP